MKYALIFLTIIFSINVFADEFGHKPCPKKPDPKPAPVLVAKEMKFSESEHLLLSAALSSYLYSELKFRSNKWRAYAMSVVGAVAVNSMLETESKFKQKAVASGLGGAVLGPVVTFDF